MILKETIAIVVHRPLLRGGMLVQIFKKVYKKCPIWYKGQFINNMFGCISWNSKYWLL